MPASYATETFFGLSFSSLNFDETVGSILGHVGNGRDAVRIVVTANVNHIVMLDRDEELKKMYGRADYILPDGMPLIWLSRLTGGILRERVTGSDLLPRICLELEKGGGRAFFFGGRPGEEEEITLALKKKYPRLPLEVYSPSFPFDPDGEEGDEIVDRANRFGADVVFGCVGTPRQERWAFRSREHLSASSILCVGAALNFVIGRETRAPKRLQRMGLEWLWRVTIDPRRVKDRLLLDLARFAPLALRETGLRLRGERERGRFTFAVKEADRSRRAGSSEKDAETVGPVL